MCRYTGVFWRRLLGHTIAGVFEVKPHNIIGKVLWVVTN